MSEFRKFMSYIYCYQQTAKIKNTGFAKMEARDEELRMQISIKGMQLLPFGNGKVYVCVQKGKYLQGICVGEITLNGGLGELSVVTSRNNIMGEQVALEEICGIYIKMQENQSVYMASAWDDVQMQYLEFVEGISRESKKKPSQTEENKEENHWESNNDKETNAIEMGENMSESGDISTKQEKEVVKEDIIWAKEDGIQKEKVPHQDKGMDDIAHSVTVNKNNIIEIKQVTDQEFQEDSQGEQVVLLSEGQEDLQAQCVGGGEHHENVDNCEKKEPHCEKHTWKDWLCNFKNIHPFECSGRVEVIRMEPKDIGRLPKECWGLSNNSFLLHGYCNYRYLILYKNLDSEKFYLGVPGMYHPREKMIAGMFGFGEFVMARKAPIRQGEFGYYVKEVCL